MYLNIQGHLSSVAHVHRPEDNFVRSVFSLYFYFDSKDQTQSWDLWAKVDLHKEPSNQCHKHYF